MKQTILHTCWLIIIILLTTVHKVYSQSPMLDSMEQVLQTEQTDTARAKTLSWLCAQYRFYDAQKAIQYGEEAISILEDYPKQVDMNIIAHYQLGVVYFLSDDNENAERVGLKAMDLCKQHDRKRKEMITCALVSGVYQRRYLLSKVLEINQRSLQLAIELNDSLGMTAGYNNTAQSYYAQDNYVLAEKYARLALEISEDVKDSASIAYALYSLSISIQDPDERLPYIDRVIEISEKINRQELLTNVYTAKGTYYADKQMYNEAIPYFRKGLQHSLTYRDPSSIASNYNYLANCHLEINQLDSVNYFAKQAIAYANQGEILQEQQYGYQRLSSYFHQIGRNDSAYFYMKETYELGDSIHQLQLDRQLVDADAKFENEQARAEIAQQELEISQQKSRTNRLLIISIGLLAALGIFFQWFYNRQNRLKKAADLALEKEQFESEQLRLLDRTKSRFFANLSHELRTPLTLILGPLKNALASNDKDKDLELAHQNSKQLLKLVNEIMDLSKLESGKLELYTTNVQIIPFLKRVFYAYESLANLRNIELLFESEIEEDLATKLDQAKVEKVLNNLMANALKFSHAGDTIVMKASEGPGLLSIEVIDGGIGIPEEDVPHLFDRFYQAQGQGEQLYGGTGIGLALAKELTQLHNGTIEVTSKPGMGSTFKVSLPIEKVRSIEQMPIPEEALEVKNPYQKANYQPLLLNGEKPKILIVEDNVEMNRFLQDMLSTYFYCYSALDGQQGLQMLHKHSIDLIISDVMMPNMDGFTFREKVIENEQWKNIPFVLLTARIEEQDKMKGLQLGISDYITKPFSTPELIARIHNLLRNQIERQQASILTEDPELDKLPADQQLLQKVEAIILENLDDVAFKVTDLAQAAGYSQRQLSRILKKQIGLSPVEMILEIRLQKAHQLIIEQRYLSVSEVRYEVGIDSASYFSKKFVERFGISPSQLLKN